jgi:hypothetical protein
MVSIRKRESVGEVSENGKRRQSPFRYYYVTLLFRDYLN